MIRGRYRHCSRYTNNMISTSATSNCGLWKGFCAETRRLMRILSRPVAMARSTDTTEIEAKISVCKRTSVCCRLSVVKVLTGAKRMTRVSGQGCRRSRPELPAMPAFHRIGWLYQFPCPHKSAGGVLRTAPSEVPDGRPAPAEFSMSSLQRGSPCNSIPQNR